MSIFERFSKVAVSKPTLIFGQLTEDMKDDDYLAAIRRINGEIEALADISDCEKVDKKVAALKKELKAVTKIYDDA